jgi:hypothetical protein
MGVMAVPGRGFSLDTFRSLNPQVADGMIEGWRKAG